MAETSKIVSGFGLRVHPDPAFCGRRAPLTNTHAKAPFDTELKTKCEALANDIILILSGDHWVSPTFSGHSYFNVIYQSGLAEADG
jgi:phosphopentomutase